MKAEIQQVKKETDHYINLASKKSSNNEGSKNSKPIQFKQKLTEDEILKRKELKRLKDEKFKKKFSKKKLKEKKNETDTTSNADDILSSNFWGGD